MIHLTDRERLLEFVSRRYFVAHKTQEQIAKDPEVLKLYQQIEGAGRKNSRERKNRQINSKLSQATINRYLQRAQKIGVVTLSIDPLFAVEMIKDEELSTRLRNAFDLPECSVLRETETLHNSPDLSKDGSIAAVEPNEDRLILALANFTAGEVAKGLVSGDHVLCGGGRTICWLARAIRRNPPSKRDLIFTPLSGRLWVGDWRIGDAEIMERPLDADDAVHIFAEAFENEPGGRFSQINQPLYKNTEAQAKEILQKHCALGLNGIWNWGLPSATKAYVGIGSLESPGHRLEIFLRKYVADHHSVRDSYLRTAGPALLNIRNLCKGKLPLPGDIANHLFPCLWLPSELKQRNRPQIDKALAAVSSEVQQLNRRSVVMSWRHLRQTPRVTLVGGGKSKLRPLFTVLLAAKFDLQAKKTNNSATPIVTELSTDEQTATALMTEIDCLNKDVDMQNWYEAKLREMGLCCELD